MRVYYPCEIVLKMRKFIKIYTTIQKYLNALLYRKIITLVTLVSKVMLVSTLITL